MKLQGLRVVSFESRLAKTMADLIRLNGGEAIQAPSMREIPLEDNKEVFLFAEQFFNNKIDVLVLLTGVGTKTLVSALETRFPKDKILNQLRRTTLVPRGPKPIRVLRELDIPFALTVPEPNTWKEILETLDQNKKEVPLSGKVVAVQEYGVTNKELLEGLASRGAKVLRVPVYRWDLPEDIEPLKKAISKLVAGEVELVFFTTAVQIEHVFRVAGEMGIDAQLKKAFENVVVASVGPDCTAALTSFGIDVDLQPESPKMGPLVALAAERAKLILQSKHDSDCAMDVRSEAFEVMQENELEASPFLKACRLEKTPFTPVWLMRQAGRYMKDYRDIRDNTPFIKICKDKDLVTEITVTAQRKLKVDAAIIFSDILLIVEPMGFKLEYLKGEGPAIQKPVRGAKDVEKIPAVFPEQSLSYVMESIRQTRRALSPDIPLIGFAGAPFTLASYLIEGGASKDFSQTKKIMRGDEALWKLLLQKISEATAAHLNAQIEAGVQAVQLFDSWVGCLTPEEYEKFALPYSKAVFKNLKHKVPSIYFGTNTHPFLEKFDEAGATVLGVDHRVNLKDAWKRVGHKKAIQGNFDPNILFKDLSEIKKHAADILAQAEGRPGHIFNLGHGVLPETPEQNVIDLVQIVHDLSSKKAVI